MTVGNALQHRAFRGELSPSTFNQWKSDPKSESC